MAASVSQVVGTVKQTVKNLKLPQFFAILFFCDKVVPAILSWQPSSLGLGSAVSIFGHTVRVSPVPVLPVPADLVAVAITLVIMAVLFAEEREKRSAKRRFFGFRDSFAIRFVLPASQPGGDPALKLSNRALYHNADADWESFRQAFASVLSTPDVKVFSQLAQDARAIGVDLGVEVDVDLVHPKRGNPLQAKFKGVESLVSFGSPASNLLTKWLCEQHLRDPMLPRFADNAIRVGQNDDEATGIVLSWQPELLDYAILARVTDETHFKPPLALFICAGVDQAGSLYTARTLFDAWETLCDETGARDFVYVYRIDRANLSNEEAYEQADATLHSAFVKAKDGAWQARADLVSREAGKAHGQAKRQSMVRPLPK